MYLHALLFQFQYGSIKRPKRDKSIAEKTSFNSNMVRLKEAIAMENEQSNKSFNSNMVRLKVFELLKDEFIVYEFQFQYGSIKRGLCTIPSKAFLRFNSNMVRLKVEIAV